MTVCAIVLAAGAGVRFGGPKGLARDADGRPWVATAVRTLREAGCDPVIVVAGADADAVGALVPLGAVLVTAPDWADGLSASVRAGLSAAADTAAQSALLVPVDVPDLPASACLRVLEAADAAPVATAALAQATYDGAPGHPALIGRAHWPAVSAAVTGDRGAGPYLRAHGALEIECGDLWHGRDVDR